MESDQGRSKDMSKRNSKETMRSLDFAYKGDTISRRGDGFWVGVKRFDDKDAALRYVDFFR
jgi:hypothetical protein